MHIDFINETNMIVFLNNLSKNFSNFNEKENFETYFKELFKKLKNNYDIDMSGYYNIKAYKDKHYGIIFEIQKEDLEYLDYYDDRVDMNITLDKKSVFLYEIDDYFNIDKRIINKIKLFKYKNNLYIQIIYKLSDIDMGKLIEFSKIIYGNKTEQIINNGKEILIDKLLIN